MWEEVVAKSRKLQLNAGVILSIELWACIEVQAGFLLLHLTEWLCESTNKGTLWVKLSTLYLFGHIKRKTSYGENLYQTGSKLTQNHFSHVIISVRESASTQNQNKRALSSTHGHLNSAGMRRAIRTGNDLLLVRRTARSTPSATPLLRAGSHRSPVP